MKINKYFLMAGLAVMSLVATSCSDKDEYTPGKEAGSNNVVFINEANQVLSLTDTQFTVELQRSNTSGDLTVPLEVLKCADVLSCPTSVTFASGSATATVTVNVSNDAEAFKEYGLSLRIPEDYTNSYLVQEGTPMLNITVLKEDYKPWGVLDYHHDFFADWNFDVEVEYSEYMDLYRMDIYTPGYRFWFKMDDTGNITICDNTGAKYTGATPVGFTYSNYGMVSATWVSTSFTGYDADEDAYFIPFKWTVSAGSFGTNYDWFTIKSKY